MANDPVSPKKLAALAKQMAALGIRDADIEETFIVGGGPGGQNAQKNATGVQLTHRPTNTQVSCTSTRSQATNRFLARRKLVEKIDEQENGRKSKSALKTEKIRKQKKRRTRRSRSSPTATDDE